MEHPADGGPVPEGMTEATDPTYPVGTAVTLTADHMEGMNGATATIVGAYDTYTYAIDYTPVGGGEPVTDHKWVVQEELENPGEERLADGTEVTVTADHIIRPVSGFRAALNHGFEIAETEPSVKGQTASSSYKPAILTNGERVMVPPYITTGTRVVILTEDWTYSERAKD